MRHFVISSSTIEKVVGIIMEYHFYKGFSCIDHKFKSLHDIGSVMTFSVYVILYNTFKSFFTQEKKIVPLKKR